MNDRTRVNNHAGASLALAAVAAATVGAAAAAGTTEHAAAAPPAPAKAKDEKHQPAFVAPQKHPAVPVDEHHGHGGTFVLVDGKRVPADEDGNPLPEKQ